MTLYITKQGTSPLAVTEIARGTSPGLDHIVYSGKLDTVDSLAECATPGVVIPANNTTDPDGIDVV